MIDPASGKPSHTRWRALGYNAAAHTTRVALEPITGRTHQLRVHLAAMGHAILGDTLYADVAVQALSPRLLLHACQLAFNHPVSGDCAWRQIRPAPAGKGSTRWTSRVTPGSSSGTPAAIRSSSPVPRGPAPTIAIAARCVVMVPLGPRAVSRSNTGSGRRIPRIEACRVTGALAGGEIPRYAVDVSDH